MSCTRDNHITVGAFVAKSFCQSLMDQYLPSTTILIEVRVVIFASDGSSVLAEKILPIAL